MTIEPPTNCPACNSVLEWSNDNLFCRNPDCGGSVYKRIEHFAKTLKIKGLGPAAIEKLDINNIAEIYEIDIAYLTFCLGSAKIAVKIFEQIENSKREPLNTVLPGFGISLIGKTATDKLSKVCSDIFDITPEVCLKAGLGPKATTNLVNWINNNFDLISKLPFTFEFEKSIIKTQDKGVICISGKLKSFKTKAEATQVLEALGYRVKDSLTKDVTILVSESGETAKTRKASESGIQIVNNLNTFIGELNNDPS